MPRIDKPCEVLAHERTGPGIYLLTLKSPHIAQNARPGQFVMVEVRKASSKDPLLRRPFSIAWTDEARDTFTILYKVIGRGTAMLAQAEVGTQLKVLGPLGRGFGLAGEGPRIIIGGGLGIAPILFLYSRLQRREHDFSCILGARTGQELGALLNEVPLKKDGVYLVTEDGGLGEKGLVTNILARLVADLGQRPFLVQACGPYPMLRAISALDGVDKGNLEVSLEAFMACGIGLCLGCAHKTPHGHIHVCKDGPVFRGSEVF